MTTEINRNAVIVPLEMLDLYHLARCAHLSQSISETFGKGTSNVQLTVHIFDFSNADFLFIVPVNTDNGIAALLLRWMRLGEFWVHGDEDVYQAWILIGRNVWKLYFRGYVDRSRGPAIESSVLRDPRALSCLNVRRTKRQAIPE